MKALLAVPLLALAACAAAPENIEPITMSSSAYAGASCGSIRTESAAAEARLVSLSEAQRKARTDDTVSVIILGIPAASLSGMDRSNEIAALKGQIDAMDARGC